jgi:predicted nuclease with TOPRIM domain
VAERDELVGAIRDGIAPMWRETQERVSNLRDGLRDEVSASETRLVARLERVEGSIQTVESRLSDVVDSVERLRERQPVVVDFERFRKLEERLARLEERLGR